MGLGVSPYVALSLSFSSLFSLFFLGVDACLPGSGWNMFWYNKYKYVVMLFLDLCRVFKSMKPLSFDSPPETDVVRGSTTAVKVIYMPVGRVGGS